MYEGTYDYMENLDRFHVNDLHGLAKLSLDYILFERLPFRNHIACLQSVIDHNMVERGFDKSESDQGSVSIKDSEEL